MISVRLASAVKSVPAGAWAVAVSGGADSVALLSLLRSRADLQLHIVHLDHQTRGQQSTHDALFVANCAARWNILCTLATREQLEPALADLPTNLSARFRALRLALFQRVVRDHHLAGIIVAHHADDQAETILHRLLRGSGYEGLCGMSRNIRLGELRICRPLLNVPRSDLRAFLASVGQTWREDSSNASDKYLRNRLRRFLALYPSLTADLLLLGTACRRLRRWTRFAAPRLPESFPVDQLANLPLLLARQSSRTWLIDRGVSPADITPQSLDRLIAMAADAASPARADFPGSLLVRRRRGILFADPRPPA
jgi:tRNA(Ile)-lysidine synthetase-like protein